MSLVRTTQNGNVIYTFQCSGVAAVIDGKADRAAHYYFNLGDGDQTKTYNQLTLSEKLAILNSRMVEFIKNAAKSYSVNLDVDTTRAATIAEEDAEIINS